MFSLHETTRKRLCRAAFCLFCVVPTVGTLVWAGYARHPHRERRWQDALARRLQVQVQLAGSQLPRPGQSRIASVALSDANDAERGASLLELQDVRSRYSARTLSLTAESASLDAASVSKLAERIANWVASEASPVDVRMERANIARRPNGQEHNPSPEILGFRDVAGRLETVMVADRGAVRRLQLRARVANQGDSAPVVQATVERWTRDGRPMLWAQIDLTKASAPVSLLASVLPGGERLRGARWTGELQLSSAGDGVDGVLTGRLDDVSLAQLLPSASPHWLEGTASIELERLEWTQGRIVRMEGVLRAGSGAASRSLVVAAVEKLYCEVASEKVASIVATRSESAMNESASPPPPDTSSSVSFDGAALWFRLNRQGLTIWGACNPEPEIPAGSIATLEGHSLLSQPTYEQLPMGLWVQFLLSPAPSWIPATRDAVETARRLPLAESTPSRQ